MNFPIALFASGTGSNAQKIMNYFANDPEVKVALLLTNNPKAEVLEKAFKRHISSFVFDKKILWESNEVEKVLALYQVHLIVLAGFLWLMPSRIIHLYPNRIINLHPALLPKFGGKGMYGMKVHEEVKRSGEKESGISIHYVNENYDEGNLIFQKSCEIKPEDSPADIARKVQLLEHEYLPKVIENLLKNQ